MKRSDNEQLGQFVQSLITSADLHEAFARTDEFIVSLGFDGLLYTYIPTLSVRQGAQPIYSVSDN